MRLLIILIVAALAYIVFVRGKSTPTAASAPAAAASSDASAVAGDHSNFVKRPLDRAHEALQVNQKRTSEEP